MLLFFLPVEHFTILSAIMNMRQLNLSLSMNFIHLCFEFYDYLHLMIKYFEMVSLSESVNFQC